MRTPAWGDSPRAQGACSSLRGEPGWPQELVGAEVAVGCLWGGGRRTRDQGSASAGPKQQEGRHKPVIIN